MIYVLATLYEPSPDNKINIAEMGRQADVLVLCDNSSESHAEMFDGIENCRYIFNGENLGLSAAFNKVLKSDEFDLKDDDYVIFFDQDSKINDGHIRNLITEFERLEQRNIRVGCIGPVFYNTNSGSVEVPKIKEKAAENIYFVDCLITSSMLTKYSVLKDVDFWNEEMFLDLADWDLCWRVIEKNYKCCLIKNIVLNQTLGRGQKGFWIFRVKEDRPIREYYQTRDSLKLMRKPYAPFRVRVRLWLTVYVRPILHLTFLGDKKERLRLIKRGKRDYRANVQGHIR